MTLQVLKRVCFNVMNLESFAVIIIFCGMLNITHPNTLSSTVKELQQKNIVIRDVKGLEDKLNILATDGPEKLQVIADFDSTLTKAVVDGKPTLHTLDIFFQTKTLSQKYRDGYMTLLHKYEPQVNKPDLSETEMQKLLDQWWLEHEAFTVGEKITVGDIQKSADLINTPLRDGCKEMLSLLNQHSIPIIVVSAGLGDVIEHVLQAFKHKVVANFVIIEENTMLGFTKPSVSVYNKHNVSFPVDKSRANVILLGDSLGDCMMADNVSNQKVVLKIGFLTGGDDKKLEKYRNCYDIVVRDDQTMYLVTALIRLVLDGRK